MNEIERAALSGSLTSTSRDVRKARAAGDVALEMENQRARLTANRMANIVQLNELRKELAGDDEFLEHLLANELINYAARRF